MHPSSCRFSKFCRYVVRTLKIFAVFLVVTVLVAPVRNVIFMNVIPGNWVQHNSAFLIRMLFDLQNFPVDSTPINPSPPNIKVDFGDIKTKYHIDKLYPEFKAETDRLTKLAKSDARAQNRLDIMGLFTPIFSEEEYATSLFTMDVFIRACNAANLPFFIVSGTLLGALRHQGIVPWDDDYDVAMRASDWVKIRDVLSGVPGFEVFAPSDVQWKFYPSNRPKTNRPFKWPNIDIFFYSEDDTYMWSVTWGFKYGLVYLKSDVYPLFYRRFIDWNLPIPRTAHQIASMEFGPDYLSVCAIGGYVHKTNERMDESSSGTISCQTIYSFFPFVFRHPGPTPGTIREEVKIGDKSISNYTIPAQMSRL